MAEALTWRMIGREDYALIRPIMRHILEGERYFTLPATASDDEAMDYWFSGCGNEVWVLEEDGKILGSFYQRKNQSELGEHIANGGYLVDPAARGKGVGRLLCERSLERAREVGYRGMQFNFVVSTNEPAVHLWKEHGFEIVGVIPKAYFQQHQNYVDAYVMFKDLTV